MAIAELRPGACRACGDLIDPCAFGTSWSEHQDLCRVCSAPLEEPARCAHCSGEIEREAEDVCDDCGGLVHDRCVCDDCGGLIHDRCVHTGLLSCAAWHRAEEQGEVAMPFDFQDIRDDHEDLFSDDGDDEPPPDHCLSCGGEDEEGYPCCEFDFPGSPYTPGPGGPDCYGCLRLTGTF